MKEHEKYERRPTMENPFTLTFGIEPKSLIDNVNPFNELKEKFSMVHPSTMAYLVSGARGAGKTVLLTRIAREFSSKDDWIVIELNPETDMLEYLASSLYEQSKSKFRFLKKGLSFSFQGISFSISGDTPVSNVVTLIEKLLATLQAKGKRVLLCVDDVYSSQSMKAFAQQYQILIRKGLPLFLLMTGLFENVRNLQNEKSLTFLYRTPQIHVGALNLADIADSFQKTLGASRSDAIAMAKLTKGYAFAYQVLGYILFEKGKSKVDEETTREFDRYLRTYVYEKAYFDLSPVEKTIVEALASSDDDNVSQIAEKAKIDKRSMSQYRDRLIKKGILASAGWGRLEFALPRFGEYVQSLLEFR